MSTHVRIHCWNPKRTVEPPPAWWAETVDASPFSATADTLAELKTLVREAFDLERWGDPEYELCHCASGNPGNCEWDDH